MGFLTQAFLRQIVTATGISAGVIFFGGSAFARGECRGPYLPCAGITDQFICQARPDCRWYELGFRLELQDFFSSTGFSLIGEFTN